MVDNSDMIEQTGALKNLTDGDREMLKRSGRRLGGALCRVLRHEPEKINVAMNLQGWVKVDELIRKFNACNRNPKYYLNLPVLMEMVRMDDKQRYGLKMEGQALMIRCRQGHSIPWLEMDYKEAMPPDILYHGTISPYLDAIMSDGLKHMARQKVHLSWDIPTAGKVARRRAYKGNPVVLQVDAAKMAADGIVFYLADNDVWLTDYVAPKYLTRMIAADHKAEEKHDEI